VEKIVLEKNVLSGDPEKQSAKGTGTFEELACGNIFRSVGYRGVKIPGVPFEDKKGIFPNQEGRIVDNGKVICGWYTSGWIKRGPSGIIGTNKPDSDETVHHLLTDVPHLKACPSPERESVKQFLAQKNVRFVTYADWKMIDAAEVKRGQPVGKPREKFTSVLEMLSILK